MLLLIGSASTLLSMTDGAVFTVGTGMSWSGRDAGVAGDKGAGSGLIGVDAEVAVCSDVEGDVFLEEGGVADGGPSGDVLIRSLPDLSISTLHFVFVG